MVAPRWRLSRRFFLVGTILAGTARPVLASETKPTVAVTKDPNCGCCTGWVKHLESHGYKVAVIENIDVQAVKRRLGVPTKLASCHTAEVNGYVIEGHVPAHAIERLLRERPAAHGLAVPGMPIGSPGMEGGEPEVYVVIMFGRDGQRSEYGRYIGDKVVAP